MDKSCEKRYIRDKKITIILLIILVFAIITSILVDFSNKSVSYAATNSSAIVIEQSSGRVLYEDNADALLPIASTTKILTALTVIDNVAELDEKIKIPKEAVGIEGSSIYLVEGETLTYRELLYGLMLRSGNDAAVALAIATAGSVDGFVALMNDKAKECGAENCVFTNPHGLHDDKHLCSARGLAKITAAAFNRETFRKIVAAKSIKISGEPVRYLANKNKMLLQYDGANGVKTGFTKKAGRCLVSSAQRDGMQLIAVVLNHADMWNDSKAMLDTAFNKYSMRVLSDGEPTLVKVDKGKYSAVLAQAEKYCYPLTDEEYKTARVVVELPDFVCAPVKNNENIGNIKVFLGERLLFSSNFYTISNIKKKGIF